MKLAKSEMMRSLDRLIRFIGILLIPFGILLFLQQYDVLELTLRDSVEATVAALIGMIPEGLYLLTSVALAVSMIRLARRRVLAQDMNCIETLARVDVLCVDKTGTITEAEMEAGTPVLLHEAAWPPERVDAVLRAFTPGPSRKTTRHGPCAAALPAEATGRWRAGCPSTRPINGVLPLLQGRAVLSSVRRSLWPAAGTGN